MRDGADGPEVAMIRPKGRGAKTWALPKGGKEDDEDERQAALREVREETGLHAEIVRELDPITYWFAWPADKVRYRKTVHYYLMRATGGDLGDHDDEVEEVRFVPLREAIDRASYRTERKLLQQVAASS